MLFTQNIDCLERTAGVPPEKIIEAHGSFATQRCIDCRTEFPDDLMHEHVKRGEPPHCIREGCGGLVKPDIVFFGEQLPEKFFSNISVPATADLVLVMGTSLLVHPFAGLPRAASEGVPRVLFNLERVGDLGTRADDVLCLGDCDSGVRKLADELGWRDELEAMWRSIVGDKEAERQLSRTGREEAIEKELEEIVEDMEDKLAISAGTEEGEPDANVGKQDEGSAKGDEPLRSDVPADVSTATNATKLVDDGVEVPSKAAQGLGEGGQAQEKQKEQEKKETSNEEKSKLTYEPLKPTTEKPITAETDIKAEDKGGGEKPAL